MHLNVFSAASAAVSETLQQDVRMRGCSQLCFNVLLAPQQLGHLWALLVVQVIAFPVSADVDVGGTVIYTRDVVVLWLWVAAEICLFGADIWKKNNVYSY